MEVSNFVKKTEESIFSIIWEALKAGENDTVMALLEGVDVKTVVDSSKKTLLHLSAFYGNAFITNHFIKCECTIDAKDDSGLTPLTLAMYYGHLEVIEILIDAGADLCSVDSYGRSPVFYGKIEDDPRIEKIIKSATKKANRYEVMKFFMDVRHFKCELNGISRIYLEGQIRYSLRFEDSEYYFNDVCDSAVGSLIKSIFLQDLPLLLINLNYRVSPNVQDANGWTALHAAATLDRSYYKKTPNAANAFEIVKILFDQGADVNAKDNKGATPLHVAATFGFAEVCDLLLKQGANVNARDNKGRTPLHVAFMQCDYKLCTEKNETVEVLLKNGADVFAISMEGETVLELTDDNVEMPIRSFILKNLAISSSLGKPVDDNHLAVIRSDEKMQSYYQRCELELRLAKEDRIIDNVTLFDLLTKSTRALAVSVKNKDFRRNVENFKCHDNYPIFAQRIQRRLEEAENRVNMTNEVAVILSEAIPYFNPDHLAFEHLLSFLTYEHLQKMTYNRMDNYRLDL